MLSYRAKAEFAEKQASFSPHLLALLCYQSSHEDVESRFLHANRAAMRILGITPDQVPGMLGVSLVPNRPDAKRRLQEAFASIEKGTDDAGIQLGCSLNLKQPQQKEHQRD